MINNRHLIEPLLQFPSEDNFYFLQILQRKKDHPNETLAGSNNNSRLIKAYFIKSLEHLDKVWTEITTLSDIFQARASINLNPRSFRLAGFQLMQKVANQMMNQDFQNIHRAYNTVCGEYHRVIDKRWLIDLDYDDISMEPELKSTIDFLCYDKGGVLARIPSKTGLHIICTPFNTNLLPENMRHIEIHKNNPTNLYIP